MIITRSKLFEIQSALRRLPSTVQMQVVPVRGRDLLGIRADEDQLRKALPLLGRYLPPQDLQELSDSEGEGVTVFLDIVVEDTFAFMAEPVRENS